MIDHQDLGNKKHQTQGLNCAAWTSTRGDVIKTAGFHYELFGPFAMKQGVFLRMERDFSGPMAKSCNMAGIPWSQQVQRWLDPLHVSPGWTWLSPIFKTWSFRWPAAFFWLVHVRFCGIPVSIHVRYNGRKRLATGSNNSYIVPTMRPFTNKTIANRAENSKDITHLIAFSEGSVLKLYLAHQRSSYGFRHVDSHIWIESDRTSGLNCGEFIPILKDHRKKR